MKYFIITIALAFGIMTSCTNAQNGSQMDTNETLENLKTRRSIRAYTDQMPAKELLEKVLEAGTYAPTGKGSQSPIIIAVTDKETRDLLSRLNAGVMGADNDPFYGAPAVLVVLADRNCPTYLYDGSLVMGNLLNAAHAVGLGSCWMGLVEAAAMSGDPQLLELLELPPGKIVTGAIVAGFPRYQHKRIPERHPLQITWVD